MALSPFTHPLIFKTLILGGKETPGTVTLSGHDRTQEFEIKKPKGVTGTPPVYHGRNLMQFSASFYLADDDDRDAWDVTEKALAALLPKSGRPKATSCFHPDLVSRGLSDVVVQSIGGMQHDGKGGSTVVVKFIEHLPAKKHKPTQPEARKSGKTITDPNAAAKAELNALLEQAKSP